jgi:hypothetical protein
MWSWVRSGVFALCLAVSATVGLYHPIQVGYRLTVHAQQAAQETTYKTAMCARYVKDVTIPDEERLRIGEEVFKTWLVQNCGTVALTGLKLVRTVGGGSKIQTPDYVVLPPIVSQETVEITIPVTPRGEGYGVMWFELLLDSGNCAPTEIPCQIRLGSPLSVVITGVQP